MSESARKQVRMAAPGEVISPANRSTVAVLGPPISVWICSDRLCSPVVHWAGYRHLPCVSVTERDPCPLCRAGWRRAVQHWLAVSREPHGRYPAQLLCLTPACVAHVPILAADEVSLWGRRLRLWRESPVGPRGLLCGEMLPDDPPAVLPPDLGVLGELHRMWAAQLRQETRRRRGHVDGRAPPSAPSSD